MSLHWKYVLEHAYIIVFYEEQRGNVLLFQMRHCFSPFLLFTNVVPVKK